MGHVMSRYEQLATAWRLGAPMPTTDMVDLRRLAEEHENYLLTQQIGFRLREVEPTREVSLDERQARFVRGVLWHLDRSPESNSHIIQHAAREAGISRVEALQVVDQLLDLMRGA